MSFNDDELVGAAPTEDPPFRQGKIKAAIWHNDKAPLEETKLKVMLELKGGATGKDRLGLDLVTVLDISGSMDDGDKLAKLKTAMQFVIKKLSSFDRLTVVTFNELANRLCPLSQVTDTFKEEIEKLVNGLVADGATNITAGLEMGKKVLRDRKFTTGRAVGIMLMSDGKANPPGADSDGSKTTIDNVPVYTFGFGADSDPEALKAIADKSMGGTFSDVQNQDNLSIAFSQCLAGLLTVAAQDLRVTFEKAESTIENVSAGNYQQYRNNSGESVTVCFGDLYEQELRKSTVDLLLPAVSRQRGSDVLFISFTYWFGSEEKFKSDAIKITVFRRETTGEKEMEEVMMEENRLRTTRMMKEARNLADDKKFEDAKDMIIKAENMLQDVVEKPNPMIEMLKYELKQLFKLMKSDELYKKEGRPFALSSETSHDRQRFAARGNNVEKIRLFATPRMEKYLEQAKLFDEDPSKPPPTVNEDVEQEIAADPLVPIVGALSYYIQRAIQSLQAIDKILSSSRST